MRRLLLLILTGLLTLSSVAPAIVVDAQDTPDAVATPSLSLTKPGSGGEIVPEGDEFATTVIGNAWDMTETIPPDVESTINIDNVSIANGTWRGTARNVDPQIYLLTRGYGQNDPCCKGNIHWRPNDGYASPIDADKYHYVSVRMKLTGSNPTNEGQFLWYRDDNPFTAPETSKAFRTSDGWQTYTYDLKALGALNGSWSGTIKGFRFDPATTAGAKIEIDWVRLLAEPAAATNYSVRWTATNAPSGALVDLFCSDSTGTVCTIGQNLPAAQGSQTWNTHFVSPGAYTISARMGTDFAALKQNDPWDMAAATDTALNQMSGTFNQPISNGLTGFSGTTSGGDPQFLLSIGTPIDASVFKQLTFDLRVNTSDVIARQVQLFWGTNGVWNAGPLVAVGTGMQHFSFDLSQYPSWTGQITGLRIDPAARLANGTGAVPVELGPVTLTTGGTDTHVYTATSGGPLTINTAPQIQITAPSQSSGPDFATSALGDAWDFNNAQDVQKVEFSPFQILSGAISGVSILSNGPDFELNTRGRQINTTKYHYLTYTMRLDDSMHTSAQQARDVADKISEGWAARALWWGPAGPPNDHCTSAWIVVEPYEYTYTIDLATAPIETGTFAGQLACGPQGKPWAQASNVTQFRFDPHEVPQPTGWSVSDIKLTGLQEGVSSLTIRWLQQEPNSGQTPTVDLFYSPVNTGASLTPIATVSDGSASYTWNTSGIARGTYYIVAKINDGVNTITRASSAPFTTNAIASACEPRPAIGVQSTPSGDGRLKVTVTASGPSNPLQSIGFDQATNAMIDITGGRTGSNGSFDQALAPGTLSYTFFLRRAVAGQATTVPFTVTDNCGAWQTFAGGGVSAPF